jgi:hypothetical protein
MKLRIRDIKNSLIQKKALPPIEFNSTIDYEGYRRQVASSVSVASPLSKTLRLAEPIDNSRDAGATQVNIKLKSSLVEIIDNGHGIDHNTLKRTLQKQGVQIKDKNDKIGRYGFGMKNTAMAFGATVMETITKSNKDVWSAKYDVVNGKIAMKQEDSSLLKEGTVVKYYLPIQTVGKDFLDANTIRKIKENLEQIYSPLNGKMKIFVNDCELNLKRVIDGKHLITKTIVFEGDTFTFDFYFTNKHYSGNMNGMETVIAGERVLSLGGDLDSIYKISPAKGRFKGVLNIPKTMNVKNIAPSVFKDNVTIYNKTLRGLFNSAIEEAYKLYQQAQLEEESHKIGVLDNRIMDVLKTFVSNNVNMLGGGGSRIVKKVSIVSQDKVQIVIDKKASTPKGNSDTLKQNLKKIQNVVVQPMPCGDDSEPYYFEFDADKNSAVIVLNLDSSVYKLIKNAEKDGKFSDYYVVIASDFQDEVINLMTGKETSDSKLSFRSNLNLMAGKCLINTVTNQGL